MDSAAGAAGLPAVRLVWPAVWLVAGGRPCRLAALMGRVRIHVRRRAFAPSPTRYPPQPNPSLPPFRPRTHDLIHAHTPTSRPAGGLRQAASSWDPWTTNVALALADDGYPSAFGPDQAAATLVTRDLGAALPERGYGVYK